MSLGKDVFHVSFETDEPLNPEQYDFAHFTIGMLLAVNKGVFAEAVLTFKCLDGSYVETRYPTDGPTG